MLESDIRFYCFRSDFFFNLHRIVIAYYSILPNFFPFSYQCIYFTMFYLSFKLSTSRCNYITNLLPLVIITYIPFIYHCTRSFPFISFFCLSYNNEVSSFCRIFCFILTDEASKESTSSDQYHFLFLFFFFLFISCNFFMKYRQWYIINSSPIKSVYPYQLYYHLQSVCGWYCRSLNHTFKPIQIFVRMVYFWYC